LLTCPEGVSVDDARQEAAQAAHGEATQEASELLPDLLALKASRRLVRHADICKYYGVFKYIFNVLSVLMKFATFPYIYFIMEGQRPQFFDL